jgi:hypothetical protein
MRLCLMKLPSERDERLFGFPLADETAGNECYRPKRNRTKPFFPTPYPKASDDRLVDDRGALTISPRSAYLHPKVISSHYRVRNIE